MRRHIDLSSRPSEHREREPGSRGNDGALALDPRVKPEGDSFKSVVCVP